MSDAWPVVPLGQVLRRRKEFVRIDDAQEYLRCRVQLHAKGVVLRDRIIGGLMKTKDQQVCRAGEFLVAEIHAKVGGFGIVPPDLEGAIVSGHYFLFGIDAARLDRRFLDYYCKTPSFRDQIQAQGSTNYAAIRPQDVLNYTMPLPPLPEQQRIVARLDVIAKRVREVNSLREQAKAAAEKLFDTQRAAAFQAASRVSVVRLERVAVLERGRFSHRPRNDRRFYGGKHPWIQIAEIERSDKYIREWRETLNDDGLAVSKKFPKGTVLVSIAATIGATGILDFDCCVPDSIVAVTPREGTDAEFLYHYLGFVRSHLEAVALQSAQKNINLQILGALPIPRIPLSEQRRLVQLLDDQQARVGSVLAMQNQTRAELAAMLPSLLDVAFSRGLTPKYLEAG